MNRWLWLFVSRLFWTTINATAWQQKSCVINSNVACFRKSRHWTKRLRRGMGGAGWVGCADWGVIPWDFRPLWLEFFGPQPRKGITMSELSNRMIRDMQLAGLVEGTRREYLRGVRQLAAYYMVSPDQLSERTSRITSSTSAMTWAWPRERSRQCSPGSSSSTSIRSAPTGLCSPKKSPQATPGAAARRPQ